jgi:hypothetical protein
MGSPVRVGERVLDGAELCISTSRRLNRVGRAGDTVDMIARCHETVSAPVFETSRRNVLRVGLRVYYCSVFDEGFMSDGMALDTRSANRCVPPADAFQESGGRGANR